MDNAECETSPRMRGVDVAESDEGLTLEAAATTYLDAEAKAIDRRGRVEIHRFISWYGGGRVLSSVTGHELTQYQEALGTGVGVVDRILPVKAFFTYAKKKTWTATNLGVHLRVRKVSRARRDGAGPAIATSAPPPRDEAAGMTPEGLIAAKEELEQLRAQRPEIAEALKLAMADKDFRENAPLDAARDTQALLEARIRNLEQQINRAVVVEQQGTEVSGRVHMGSSVTATNLVSGRTIEYTLVGQNEADAAAGKISVASPVGRAFMGSGAGDEVEVAAPSGVLRFRVESVAD